MLRAFSLPAFRPVRAPTHQFIIFTHVIGQTLSRYHISCGGKDFSEQVHRDSASSEGSSSLMDKVIFRFILPSQMSKLNRFMCLFPLHVTNPPYQFENITGYQLE